MKKKFLAEKCKQLQMSENEVVEFMDLINKEMDQQLPLLQQAIDNANYIEIQSISHRVKSQLLNLKLDYLGNLAQDINLASFLKSDLYSIRSKYDQLKNGFDLLRYDS